MIGWLETVFPNVLIASRDAAMLALCIGFLLWVFGRKIPSTWRHVIWLIVALRLLLPVLPGSALSWQVLLEKENSKVAVSVPEKTLAKPVEPINRSVVLPAKSRSKETADFSIAPVLESSSKWTPALSQIMAIIWAAGCALCLVGIVVLSFRFRRNVIRLAVENHPRAAEIETVLINLCQKFGVSHPPGLIITEAVEGPALTGAIRRNVLLPPSSLELLDEKQTELVLLHELAHLRRFDLWTGWVLCLLQAAHWFNPLVWWGFHRVRIEAERATDDWVLRQSGAENRQDYGEMLLSLLESASSRNTSFPGVVGVLESRRDLHRRLAAIARFRKRRSRLAVFGAIALISGLAVVGLTQAPQEKEKKTTVATEKESQTPEDSTKPKTPPVAKKDLDSLNPFPAPGPGDPPLGKSREVIDAFMKAPDWKSRLPLIYHGEHLKPVIAEYYKKWPYNRAEKFSLQLFQHQQNEKLDGPYWVYLVSTGGSDSGFPIIVRVENGKLKVDWEIYSEFQDKHFIEFINGKLSSPNSFRVVLEQKADYYGPDHEAFTDRDDYLCFQMSPPYGEPSEFSKYAFVKKGTPLAKLLNKAMPLGGDLLASIVTIDYKKFAHGVKHIVISEWIEGWFSKTQASTEKEESSNLGKSSKPKALQAALQVFGAIDISPTPRPGGPSLEKSREVIEAFLNAPNWEARIPLIYEGDSLKSVIADYHKKFPFTRTENFSLQLLQMEKSRRNGGPYRIYLVSTNDGEEGFPIVVREENGKFKVDWEIYAEFQDRHFIKFTNGIMPSPGSFRVMLDLKHEYSGPDRDAFTNLDDYLCIKVSLLYTCPDEFAQVAFVKKGTPLAKFFNSLSGRLISTMKFDFKTFPHGVKHMIITEMVRKPPFAKLQPPLKMDEIKNPEGGKVAYVVRAMTRVGDKPISGALVKLLGIRGENLLTVEAKTDQSGKVTIKIPKGISSMRAFVRKDGFTPYWTWLKSRHPFTFHLDPAIKIGGLVKDKRGNPIVGAEIDVGWNLLQKNVPREDYQWSLDDPEKPILTDKEGKWSHGPVPVDFYIHSRSVFPAKNNTNNLRVKIKHPKYVALELREEGEEWAKHLLAGDAVVTLADSQKAQGIVLDKAGKPLESVSVREVLSVGQKPEKNAITDGEGKYTIYLQPGNHLLHYSLDGYAAAVHQVGLEESRKANDLGETKLTQHKPLMIRILDETGKPVKNASFHAYLRKSERIPNDQLQLFSAETNDKGEFIWNSPMPSDDWHFTCFKRGFLSLRKIKPKPEADLLTLTLNHAVTVSGTITDKSTGKPIKAFHLVRGQRMEDGSTHWFHDDRLKKNQQGKYSYQIDEPNEANFKVAVDGYLDAVSKDYARDGKQKKFEENFALELIDEIPEIEFLLSDGKTPASEGKLLMHSETMWIDFNDLERLGTYPQYPTYICDKDGKMAFPETSLANAWLIHPKGYLRVTKKMLKEATGVPFRLKSYSTIEGNLLINGKTASNRTLSFYSNIPRLTDKEQTDGWQVTVTTDEKGHFLADQLIPAEETYQISIIDKVTGKRTGYLIGKVKAEAERVNSINLNFDEAARVNVKGRFVTRDGKPLKSVPFNLANFSYLSQFGEPYSTTNGILAKDGAFLTVAILPGRYTLSGRFHFKNGEMVEFNNPWLIPADAIEKAKDGIYDVGDIPIDYPLKNSTAKPFTPGRVLIRVVDEQSGKPLEGAKIVPTGLGTKDGSGLAWPEGMEGIDPEVKSTDKNGNVEIRFPVKSTRTGSENFGDATISRIYFSISHPEYPTKKASLTVESAPDEIKMLKGAGLKIILKRSDKGEINAKGITFQISGPLSGLQLDLPPSEWKSETLLNGDLSMAHRRIPTGDRLVRCVYRDENNQLFYSDARPQKFKSGGEVSLSVTLKPGVKFAGSLGENVPRPVEAGWIMATVVPEDDSLERLYGKLFWLDAVEIDESGSFQFPGLPAGKIFVHASCKGWANKINPAHWGSNQQEISKGERKQAVIEMKANGKCRITVLKPDGSPLSGAKVYMFPNQRVIHTGSIFGELADALIKRNRGREKNEEADTGKDELLESVIKLAKKWEAVTDESGKATISYLPFEGSEMIQIEHPDFRITLNQDQRRILYAEVLNGKTVEITVKMEKKH